MPRSRLYDPLSTYIPPSFFGEAKSMIGENRQLVTNELVEVQDRRKITDHFRGIYRIYPKSIKENRGMSTCNWLDLQILGSQPIMPKNLPDRWAKSSNLFKSVSVQGQWSGRFLVIIIGWDPSVCKSSRLHVDILRFSFIKLGYIL